MNFLHTEYDSEPDDSLEKSMSLVASAISDPSRVSITTPSKYPPARMVGIKSDRRINFNYKWDGEVFSPKDNPFYLVKIWGACLTTPRRYTSLAYDVVLR